MMVMKMSAPNRYCHELVNEVSDINEGLIDDEKPIDVKTV